MDIKEVTREAIAIGMIVLAIVVLISLLTYAPEDYSDQHHTDSPSPVIKNKAGLIGKVLSGFLYTQIGAAGYVLVFFIILWGALLAFSKKPVPFFWYRFLASLLLVFACAHFASLNSFKFLDPKHPSLNEVYPVLKPLIQDQLNLAHVGLGGKFGYVTTLVSMKLTGRVGSEIISIGMILITLEFAFGFLFSTLIGKGARWCIHSYRAFKARKDKTGATKKDEPIAEPEIKVKDTPAKPVEEPKDEPAPPKDKPRKGLFSRGDKPPIEKPDKPKPPKEKKPKPVKKKPVEPPKEGDYVLPSIDLLEDMRKITRDKTEIQEKRARIIEEVLFNFKIEGKAVAINPGPVITQYEIELGAGIRVNAVLQLSDNLSMALQSPGIRIEAPIPGKSTVGIEVPNKESEFVQMRDLMNNISDKGRKAAIPLLLGKDTRGRPVEADLSGMPHLLIAGATGSGKTVGINSIIISILLMRTPDEVKLIIVDPKMVDMSAYRGIPHLLTPVVTDASKAENVLNWAVNEMERRYKLFSSTGARNLATYNKLKKDKIDKSLEELGNPRIYPNNEIPYPMPYLVIVVDELADLMFASPKEIEFAITRIAQKARAAGIHLILSTQRPSVDVITGLIKSNIPSRIAFQVAAKVDSRTILDMNGAETLLGHGDMLYLPPGQAKAKRGQGVFVSDQEITDIVAFCKAQAKPLFSASLEKAQQGGGGDDVGTLGDIDSGLEDAIRVTCETQRGSASLLQRKLGFGYNRATKLVETMEILNVVGPYQGSKAREVLMSVEEFEEIGGLQGILDRHEENNG